MSRKILISGSHGLIGGALVPRLSQSGWTVIKLLRQPSAEAVNSIPWDPLRALDSRLIEGLDAVIHLAGENVASPIRWTKEKKRRLWESRITSTQKLVASLNACANPPKVFICASAIGYYGRQRNEVVSEESTPGTGFLAELTKAWEEAASQATKARVVFLRIGIVLAKDGGALKKILPPFKFGLGGVIGSGNQMMSWVALSDMLRIIEFVLANDHISGPVNAAAPNPVSNREFTKELGRVLHRPTLLPVPEFAVKAIFGEMGEETILSSAKVSPKKLLDAGFTFEYPMLADALKAELNNS